jgi:hypothetical protein
MSDFKNYNIMFRHNSNNFEIKRNVNTFQMHLANMKYSYPNYNDRYKLDYYYYFHNQVCIKGRMYESNGGIQYEID